MPVSQWNLKFCGEKVFLSLAAFLERVGELCIARNFPLEMLLDSAIVLFARKALVWFRSVRHLVVRTWPELVDRLKEEFQPYDYDNLL